MIWGPSKHPTFGGQLNTRRSGGGFQGAVVPGLLHEHVEELRHHDVDQDVNKPQLVLEYVKLC